MKTSMLQGLIRLAAERVPPGLRERMHEEWLADLDARTTKVSRLRFALGCLWASQAIAVDMGLAAPAGQRIEAGILAFGAPASSARRQQRPGLLAAIIAFHIVVIYGFAVALTHSGGFPHADKPMQGTLYDPPERPHQPVPVIESTSLPGPRLERTIVDVPVPLIHVPEAVTPTAVITPNMDDGQPLHTAPVHVVQRIGGGPGAGFPTTNDYYPDASRRTGEVGAAIVRACVDARGRLNGAPTIAQSSGSPRLDAGALDLARAGSGHYRSTTEDGKPVNDCYSFRVRFQLRD